MVIDTTKIQIIMAEQGLTWSEYATAAKLSRQNISSVIKRGTCTPKTAGKLAAGLDVSVSEIVKVGTA